MGKVLDEGREEQDGEVRSVVERARGSVGVGAGGEEGVRTGSEVATSTEAEAEAEAETETDADADTVPLAEGTKDKTTKKTKKKLSAAALDLQQGRVVDVVLSDMCAPFPGLKLSTWINSVNRPYRRMMNTSGNPFRDHAGSIVSIACVDVKPILTSRG